MAHEKDVVDHLARLKVLSPSGYALALHIHFNSARFQFVSYPKAWTDHYSQNGLVMRDPVVAWGLGHLGWVRWDDLADQDAADVIGQARSFGIENGQTLSIQANGTRTITGFSRQGQPFSDEELAEIHSLTSEIHSITSDLNTLSSTARDRLRKLSITFTHP
jgi:LuxR family transcriptional regulator